VKIDVNAIIYMLIGVSLALNGVAIVYGRDVPHSIGAIGALSSFVWGVMALLRIRQGEFPKVISRG
jgi:multisubunit Na+/H+ antiporter MnhF subunit